MTDSLQIGFVDLYKRPQSLGSYEWMVSVRLNTAMSGRDPRPDEIATDGHVTLAAVGLNAFVGSVGEYPRTPMTRVQQAVERNLQQWLRRPVTVSWSEVDSRIGATGSIRLPVEITVEELDKLRGDVA